MSRIFERPLNIKARKVNPHRRMQYTHPFYIWQVLMRFRTMDKLINQEGTFRTKADIARQLFSNWDELTASEQELVICAKMNYPMACLKTNHLIEERTEKVRNPEYKAYYARTSLHYSLSVPEMIDKGVGEFRAKPGAFGDWQYYDVEERQQATAEHLDESWRRYTGQMNRYDKAERWLKKRGLIPA
jgi:hypothetical protein